MPLARAALYEKGVTLYLSPNTNDNPEWQDAVRHIAREGRCFFINADLFFTRDMYPAHLRETAEVQRLPQIVCRGGSCIVDPFGHDVTQPVWYREEIIFAELDMTQAAAAKMELDVCGHYARPDVLRFLTVKRPVSAMKLPVLTTLQGYKKENLPKDLLSGVVIAAVSIPISMGYAQIAGLPAVYGPYGSVLPVLLFALFSTSPQFIFGVDAAPAAMVGAVLSSLGVALGSGEAVALVPVLTFYTSLWLLLFARAARGEGAQLHLHARHGRIHQRHLLHHHPHANPEAPRWHGWNRRAAGADAASHRRLRGDPLAVACAGAGGAWNSARR